MDPPDDHDDDERSTKAGGAEELPPAPVTVEREPVVVGYATADFENMLGGYSELAFTL